MNPNRCRIRTNRDPWTLSDIWVALA